MIDKTRQCTVETCPIADMRCPNCFPHEDCALYDRKTEACRMKLTIFDNLQVIDNKEMAQCDLLNIFMEMNYPRLSMMNKMVVTLLVEIAKDHAIDLYHCIEWMAMVSFGGKVEFHDRFGEDDEDTIDIISHEGMNEVIITVVDGGVEKEWRLAVESR